MFFVATDIGRKLARGVVQDSNEGDADRTQAGGFDGRVISCKSGTEIGSADIELLGKFFGLAIDTAEKSAESH